MKSNLQQYFKENQEKGIFDHHVRATDDGDKVIIYIHPQKTDGKILDFSVTGNELTQLYVENDGEE